MWPFSKRTKSLPPAASSLCPKCRVDMRLFGRNDWGSDTRCEHEYPHDTELRKAILRVEELRQEELIGAVRDLACVANDLIPLLQDLKQKLEKTPYRG